MANENIKCSCPGCKKCLAPDAMWLPEHKALVVANGGKPVTLADFPRFALCGYHGHLLREEGVRVYRYLSSVEREKAIEERREAEQLNWRPFAQRFVAPQQAPKREGKGRDQQSRRGRDGRGVGGGLSRCAEMDAKARSSKPVAEPPPADGSAPAPAPEKGEAKPA